MTKRYEITITETVVETVVLPAEWVQGGVQEKDHPESNWGWCSEKETRQTVTREIYNQSVESLDLREVIYAVNAMTPSEAVE